MPGAELCSVPEELKQGRAAGHPALALSFQVEHSMPQQVTALSGLLVSQSMWYFSIQGPCLPAAMAGSHKNFSWVWVIFHACQTTKFLFHNGPTASQRVSC